MSRVKVNAIRNTAASSDAVTFDASGNTAILGNITCAGTATGFGGGKVLQFKQTVKTDVFSTSINEGTISGDVTGLTVSITPSSATNIIYLDVRAIGGVDGSTGLYGYFYKNGSLMSNAVGDASGSLASVSMGSQQGTVMRMDMLNGNFADVAGGTSAITYSIRIRSIYAPASPNARTLYINRAGDSDESNGDFQFPRLISTITAMELEPSS